ncbi:ABC-2 family transporter protein [Paenibacillus sediminis]|nr:ABC-2 family transporter protein [Paenibacillus sediminis]
MVRYMKLYWHFFAAQVKVMTEYWVDFIIGFMSVFFIQFTSVYFIKVVFDHIDVLNGWTFYEILFIYGIASTGRSIHQIFFDNLWLVGRDYIRTGNFDRLLIRPLNPLFHLIADKVQQDGVGNLVLGTILLGISMNHLAFDWGFWDIVLLIVMVISSGLIYSGINLFFVTFSFWMVDSFPLMQTAFNVSQFARYPLTIYSKPIRIILTWVVPYGFTSFYPATLFTGHKNYTTLALITPAVAAIICVIAYGFWIIGLRAYTSTGN